jgi:hypothetical protein
MILIYFVKYQLNLPSGYGGNIFINYIYLGMLAIMFSTPKKMVIPSMVHLKIGLSIAREPFSLNITSNVHVNELKNCKVSSPRNL